MTVTFNAATPFVDIRARNTAASIRSIRSMSGTSASGNSTTANSGAVTTTAARELIFGAGMTIGVFTAAGTNFTNRIITPPDFDIAEDRFVTATGSYSATASLGGSPHGSCRSPPSGPRRDRHGDGTEKRLAITAPTGGASVSGTVTVAATASDNVGVAGVQFLLDNNALGCRGHDLALQHLFLTPTTAGKWHAYAYGA